MNVDPTGTSFLVFLFAALIGYAVSFATSAITQAVFNDGQVDWGVAAIDGLFGAASATLWMVPGLGAATTGLINAGLTAVNGIITTGMQNNWQYTWQDGVSIMFSAVVSGVASGVLRNQFFKADGRSVLTEAHKHIGNILNSIINGKYNNGKDIFSGPLKNAVGDMFSRLVKLNFGKGFYRDWIKTFLLAIFSTSFSGGLNNLKW